MMKLSLKDVIATDQAGDVYALNPKSGVVDWDHNAGAPLGPPSIANGVVYFNQDPLPGAPGGVSGLNASTGDPLFHVNFGSLNPQPLPPFPAIVDGTVFTSDFNGGAARLSLSG